MDCGDFQEQLSARLDGEDDRVLRAAVDGHLQTCEACRRWLDEAARVTRLGRTTAAHPTPDLTGIADRYRRRIPRPWPRLMLRAALALLGVGQLVLGLAHIWEAAPVTVTHANHEFAAWNIALGIGFLWIAWHSARTAGVVPILGAFVLLLTGLELYDIVRGHVEAESLLSHSLVQAGLIVVLALRSRRLGGQGFSGPARTSIAPA